VRASGAIVDDRAALVGRAKGGGRAAVEEGHGRHVHVHVHVGVQHLQPTAAVEDSVAGWVARDGDVLARIQLGDRVTAQQDATRRKIDEH